MFAGGRSIRILAGPVRDTFAVVVDPPILANRLDRKYGVYRLAQIRAVALKLAMGLPIIDETEEGMAR